MEHPGWGAAQADIRAAIEFLCDGKSPAERAEIADELTGLVRALVRGEFPVPVSSPHDHDEFGRESWARATAHHLVAAAMRAAERYPKPDQVALLREIARRALWHTPNSDDELKKLRDYFKIENLRQPHQGDAPFAGRLT